MLQVLQQNKYLKLLYFQRTEMEKWLLLSCLFSLLLEVARIIITGSLLFAFMPWNLFLAFVPYYISSQLEKRPGWIENKWKFVVVIAVWLLFLPNSFYIITDLFHLEFQEGSSRWFDLTLIFSFAWNGLLLGILSIRQIERIFRHCFQYKNEFLFLLPVMWLNAWGIYIGRFMRFNSWDILTNPFELFADIGYMLIHPFRNMYPWGMIMVFAIFMTIIYMSVKRMAKVI